MINDTHHDITVPGAFVTRSITTANLVAYLLRRGWLEIPTEEPEWQRCFDLEGVTLDLSAGLRVAPCSEFVRHIEFLSTIEGRSESEVLRDIAGEPTTVEAAQEAIVQVYAKVFPELDNAEAWRSGKGSTSDIAIRALENAGFARALAKDEPHRAEDWMAVAIAAEDLAVIALEQVIAARPKGSCA